MPDTGAQDRGGQEHGASDPAGLDGGTHDRRADGTAGTGTNEDRGDGPGRGPEGQTARASGDVSIGSEDDEVPVGEGLGRVLALTDGVFAIAITLLVLDLRVPAKLSEAALRDQINDDVLPSLGAAALSFLVIAVFWLSHRRLFARFTHADERLLRLSLAFLGPIVLMPFSTQLLASYGARTLSVSLYAATIAATAILEIGIVLYVRTRPSILPPGRRGGELGIRNLVVIAGVFLLSIPVAVASPAGAKYFWLSLLLIRLATRLTARSHRAPDAAP